MAENEYLDSSKARCWQFVAQAIRDGERPEIVADRIERCLHSTLKQIRRDLPLGELIRALDESDKLHDLYDQIDGAQDVKDFLVEAADMDANLTQKLESFLQKSLDNCLYDIPWLVADETGDVSITEARNLIKSACSMIHPEIERIAKKLAENPDRDPQDRTKAMLTESLLSGFRE